MTEAEWLDFVDPRPMLDAFQPGDRILRLFAVACCRRIWDVIDRERSRTLLLVAERFADGLSGADELQSAHDQVFRAEDNLFLDMDANNVVLDVGPTLNAKSVVGSVVGIITYSGGEELGEAARQGTFDAVVARREADESRTLAALLHDVVGNPFRPVALDTRWLTSTVTSLAAGIYAERAFDRMPILANALEEAGCDHADILAHCRGDGPHVRGCWVVDLLRGKV